MNKLLLICAGILLITSLIVLNIETQGNEIKPVNYYGLVKLGLAPSTNSRQLEEQDIDTGIKLTDGDNVYSLIESRTWKTLDYGKTFVVRIE